MVYYYFSTTSIDTSIKVIVCVLNLYFNLWFLKNVFFPLMLTVEGKIKLDRLGVNVVLWLPLLQQLLVHDTADEMLDISLLQLQL